MLVRLFYLVKMTRCIAIADEFRPIKCCDDLIVDAVFLDYISPGYLIIKFHIDLSVDGII